MSADYDDLFHLIVKVCSLCVYESKAEDRCLNNSKKQRFLPIVMHNLFRTAYRRRFVLFALTEIYQKFVNVFNLSILGNQTIS